LQFTNANLLVTLRLSLIGLSTIQKSRSQAANGSTAPRFDLCFQLNARTKAWVANEMAERLDEA